MTDIIKGVIAKIEGETLDTYCKPERCRLYHTKPDAIPVRFMPLLHVAETLRERRLNELKMPDKLPAWKVTAYTIAERARRIVENEQATGDTEKPPAIDAETQGDSSAFKWETLTPTE